MGYSEDSCQLCGVSFCIGRRRRHEEPESAAWTYAGEIMSKEGTFEDAWSWVCGDDSEFRGMGCREGKGSMIIWPSMEAAGFA